MISLFVNPLAGKGKALRIASLLEQELSDRGVAFTAYNGNWPPSLSGCSEAWIIGGDGTMNYFINRYPDVDIPLALFGGGTGDDFAWKLYGNLPFSELVDYILKSPARSVDAGSCNGKLFLNSVGIGFDGEVLKSMSTIRKLGGHIGYLWVVIKQIFRFREYGFRFNQQTGDMQKLLLVNIANAPRTGGGFMVSPKADIHDGELDLVTCRKLSVLKRLRFLPVIEKGRHLQLDVVRHARIKDIHVETDTESYAQIDGELIRSRHYNISVLPAKFRFRC